MKMIPFLSVVFLFLFNMANAVELIPQKIGISIDPKNKYYKIDVLLKKNIFDMAATNASIYILSDEKDELDIFKIKELNGRILLKTSYQNARYRINLFEYKDKITNLVESNIIFTSVIDEIDFVCAKVIDRIVKYYPPKEQKELTTIEIQKETVSEFEKQKPAISVRFGTSINLQGFGLGLGFKDVFFNGGNWVTNYKNIPASDGGSVSLGLMPEVLFEYRWFQMKLKGGTSFNDFFGNLSMGVGLFGDLIFLGMNTLYYTGSIVRNNMIMLDSSSVDSMGNTNIVQLHFPKIEYQIFYLGGYIQLNITKDYYIVFGGGGALYKQFKFNFQEPGMTNIIDYNKIGGGGPYFDILFNIGLNKQSRIFINYMLFFNNMSQDTSSTDPNRTPILLGSAAGTTNGVPAQVDIYLMRIDFARVYFGIGYQYEF